MQKDSFSPEACKAFVQENFIKSALPSLEEYIRIQNMSKDYYLHQNEWLTTGWT
jgi:hypothetical protein